MQAYSKVQVFNLSILPGTAFRREAEHLGCDISPGRRIMSLQTPSLDMDDILLSDGGGARGVRRRVRPLAAAGLIDASTSDRLSNRP